MRIPTGEVWSQPSRSAALATLAGIRRWPLTFIALGLGLVLAACGASATDTTSRNAGARRHRAGSASRHAVRLTALRLVYRPLFSLAAPLRDPASAPLRDGRFVLLGGLDAADSSAAGIEVADRRGLISHWTLSLAQHDAQAATLGARVYVFGGGSFSELNHILSFDPASGSVVAVGTLPSAQSDVAVTEIAGTAYVVGGYDGTNWLNTILAWRPGSPVRVAGHLPMRLRYAAAAAVDGTLLVIGGSTPTGASNAIYRFDPRTGRVRQIGRLPHAVTHGAAAALGSYVYMVGGRGDLLNAQTAAIWSIDPATGAVRAAGHLRQPTSDAGVVTVGRAIVIAGGYTPAGTTLAGVGELVPEGP